MGCLGSLFGMVFGIIGGVLGLVFGVVGSVLGGVGIVLGVFIPVLVLALPVLICVGVLWVIVRVLRGPDADTHVKVTHRPNGRKDAAPADEPRTPEEDITDVDEWEDLYDKPKEDQMPPHRRDDDDADDKNL